MHSALCAVKGWVLAKGEPTAKALRDTGFSGRLKDLLETRYGITRPSQLAKKVGVHRNNAIQWFNGTVPSGYQLGWIIVALELRLPEIEHLVGKPKALREAEGAAETRRRMRDRPLRGAGPLDELQAAPAPRTPKPPK